MLVDKYEWIYKVVRKLLYTARFMPPKFMQKEYHNRPMIGAICVYKLNIFPKMKYLQTHFA